jgi:hypothetical protein
MAAQVSNGQRSQHRLEIVQFGRMLHENGLLQLPMGTFRSV